MSVNLEKVRPFSALTLFQCFCLLLSGILFLFIFNRPLFLSLDLFRLSMLGVSITAPVLALNTILVQSSFDFNRDDVSEDQFHRLLGSAAFLGTLLSFFVLYVPILLGYFFDLSIKCGIAFVLITQVLMMIIWKAGVLKGGKWKIQPDRKNDVSSS